MRWIIVTFMLAMTFGQAVADPFVPFQEKWGVARVSGPAMDKPENRGKEFYSEWWAILFRPGNGYTAYARFMVYNLGPGDEKLKVKARFSTPDGHKYVITRTFSKDEWKNNGGLSISADGNLLKYDGKTFYLKLNNKKFRADLTMKPRFKPWSPGNGRIRYGKGSDYYALDIPMPLGDLSGSFTTLDNGKIYKMGGIAYIDHQAMNAGMQTTTKSMYRFRELSSEQVVFMAALTPPPQYGNRQATCVVAFMPDGIIQAVGMQIFVKKWWTDPESGGYRVPKVLVFKGKTSDGKPLRGAVVMKKLASREDFLKGLNTMERFIVSKFAKPVDYSFGAVMAVEVGTGPDKKAFKTNGSIFFTGVNH